jgi:branched-chain amino acid transport system permease protein
VVDRQHARELVAKLGGVVLGVAQQIGAQINISDEVLAGFIVFLAVLVVRPQGLISRRAQS